LVPWFSRSAEEEEMGRRIPLDVKRQVLIETGFQCGNPACRNILTLEIHHIVPIEEGGGNKPENLLPLCGHCHDLYHRGHIPREAIKAWKMIALSLSHAFDRGTIDILLALDRLSELYVSGDGVLKCAPLIAAGLVQMVWAQSSRNGGTVLYCLRLTEKGKLVAQGWKKGDLTVLRDIDLLIEQRKKEGS